MLVAQDGPDALEVEAAVEPPCGRTVAVMPNSALAPLY